MSGLDIAIARGGRTRDPLYLYWALFAAAVFFFCLDRAFAGQLGPLALPVAIMGSSTCGVSWLLAHALFRPSVSRWPLVVVAALFAIAALIEFMPAVAPGSTGAALIGMVHKARSLLSSTVLILTFLEPIRGYGSALSAPERRFRMGFIAAYAALVAASVLPDIASIRGLGPMWEDATKVASALIALLGFSGAVAFRARFPLIASPTVARKPTALPDTEYLRVRIMQKIEQHEAYKTPELKVADLARMVGEQEYKVSQCIGQMGFKNFNRLINTYRIALAKQMLSDPKCDDRSILTVAMDCGFGSIGPFNRAFRLDVGMTPKEYRHRRPSEALNL